jgi:hypothetical protein
MTEQSPKHTVKVKCVLCGRIYQHIDSALKRVAPIAGVCVDCRSGPGEFKSRTTPRRS